jgi:subtilisin family serine protease
MTPRGYLARLGACCLLLGAFGISPVLDGQSSAANPVLAGTPKYIIGTTPGTPIAPLAAKYQLSVETPPITPPGNFYSVTATTPLSANDAANLASEAGVVDLEPNATVNSTEADPSAQSSASLQALGNLFATRATVQYYGSTVLGTYVNQPGTQMIELGAAQSSFGAGSALIAIIDTGVDPDHPALAGALVPGYDFTRDSPDTVSELLDLPGAVADALQQSTVELLDAKQYTVLQQSTVEILDQSTVELLDGNGLPSAFGHGTMVAGLIHLVSPGAQIMPLKAFHADGTASIYDVARAIRYAVDNGADVISMSFGYPTSSPVLRAAIAYATGNGVICVASAGNQGTETVMYPAGYRRVFGVGSVNSSGVISSFSNSGSAVETSAPGEALVTLFPGGNYAAVWGTSFSSALVAGAAGMIKSVRPNSGYSDVDSALDAGVPIDPTMEIGRERLDLLRSLTWLLQPSGSD